MKFIDFIDEPSVLERIAEGFIDKKDFKVAETILKELATRQPGNMKVLSRLNYVYSMVQPEKINADLLPQFDVITDYNHIKVLENDYLSIIKANTLS